VPRSTAARPSISCSIPESWSTYPGNQGIFIRGDVAVRHGHFFEEQHALNGLVRNLCLQHLLYLIQRESQLFQHENAIQARQLLGAVIAVARLPIDARGFQ
jgi:hypothetical protein